jgi:hypothetical protein
VSDWLLGDMRLAPWQREVIDQMMHGGTRSVLAVSRRPSRRERVIGDAYMLLAAMFNDEKIVFVGPDDRYADDVRAEAERILERFRE